ncbi:hypothetical protein Pmani_010542 [Petrolisthes manimaculis]|uniref:Uncharacterized protein n=1 Tax=Petrolisthes manimaculis TaxID=1843537 RepID=A0AAE1Q1D0_9EUCA|nr:hypothetical protein Pmani_010542 [Petrolisthes manimaculis]
MATALQWGHSVVVPLTDVTATASTSAHSFTTSLVPSSVTSTPLLLTGNAPQVLIPEGLSLPASLVLSLDVSHNIRMSTTPSEQDGTSPYPYELNK